MTARYIARGVIALSAYPATMGERIAPARPIPIIAPYPLARASTGYTAVEVEV
ncbi:hypothetical protein [Rhodococcus opacus]|uniref:hypothetical protein n=1 Tax=Rhodococcus opacus TaxID=37919 RepID=UPI0013053A0A|nr:hypothetical protein [Rhodococcus opacus]